ncbi:MAG TPA: SDR family oxidoreductase [Chloroflexota bacterium]|nr:SDR family oxidoreductase [Chloroflexota bacterium]
MDVLVTGSSSGFGELTVKALASAGHRVFASMRNVESRNAPAAQMLREWARRHSADLDVVELDVLSEGSSGAAIDFILGRTGGRIDVVVNNAGASASGPIEAFTMEQIEGLFSLNAFGPLRVCKAVLPAMRAQGSGLIIFITSTLGRVLPGRGGLYPATKWAEEGLAESLCYQVRPFGIDVAIVEPGAFPTPAHGKVMLAADSEIEAAYAAVAPPAAPPRPDPPIGHREPDPSEVADAVKQIIALPAGQRPLRTVVGPVFTEGVAEYNSVYDRTRAHLAEVLRRPDQAITWSAPSAASKVRPLSTS